MKQRKIVGEHAGKVVGAEDTRISSVSSSVSIPVIKKKRKSLGQSNQDRIHDKQVKIDFDIRYNNAMKEALCTFCSFTDTFPLLKILHD